MLKVGAFPRYESVRSPHRLSFGVNILYWIDDDAAGGGLGGALRSLPVSTLRFPGGEVADNYDWKHNAVVRPNEYPGEAASAALKSQRLDYKEFLRQAKDLGIKDIFFVVNLESAYLEPGDTRENILLYARKAAAWVSAVKRLGYKVRYWELGNESYLHTSYSLTAHEYAGALAIFSREMKRADPDIRVGANGPSQWDEVGFADRMTPAQRRYFRTHEISACAGRKGTRCLQEIRDRVPGHARGSPWWKVVVREARSSFDFAAFHDYRKPGEPWNGLAAFSVTARIAALRKHLDRATGKWVEIAVTEWNDPLTASSNSETNAEIALDDVVKLGNFVGAEVGHVHFWPLRFRNKDKQALLSFDARQPTAVYRALGAAAPALSGRFVGQEIVGGSVYVLKTRNERFGWLVIVNRGGQPRAISVSGTLLQVRRISGRRLHTEQSCRPQPQDAPFALPPLSVTLVKVDLDTGISGNSVLPRGSRLSAS